MKIAVELIANFLQKFLEIWFITKFCGHKYSGAKKYVSFCAAWLINVIVISVVNILVPYDGVLSLLCVAVMVVYAKLFLKRDIYTKIFVSVFTELIVFNVGALIIFSFSIATGSSFLELINDSTCVRLFILIIARLIEFGCFKTVINLNKEYHLKRHEWFMIICVVILSFVSITIYTNASLEDPLLSKSMLLLTLIMVVIIMIIYYCIIKIHREDALETENKLLKMQNDNIKNTEESLKLLYEQQSALKHDLEKHFLALSAMFENKQYDNAEEYVNRIMERDIKGARKIIYTGNSVFDAVMNVRLEICAAKGIEVNISIDKSSVYAMDAEDITVIFGNLFDNAIEAALKAEEKRINLSIENKGGYISVMMGNTFRDEPSSNMQTTKPDKLKHGYGIKNIYRAVKKYDGTVDFYTSNNIFYCNITVNSNHK